MLCAAIGRQSPWRPAGHDMFHSLSNHLDMMRTATSSACIQIGAEGCRGGEQRCTCAADPAPMSMLDAFAWRWRWRELNVVGHHSPTQMDPRSITISLIGWPFIHMRVHRVFPHKWKTSHSSGRPSTWCSCTSVWAFVGDAPLDDILIHKYSCSLTLLTGQRPQP